MTEDVKALVGGRDYADVRAGRTTIAEALSLIGLTVDAALTQPPSTGVVPTPAPSPRALEPLRFDMDSSGSCIGAEIGADLYRARNIAWTQRRMIQLRADRVWAIRDGAEREVAGIDAWLAVYRRALSDLGAPQHEA